MFNYSVFTDASPNPSIGYCNGSCLPNATMVPIAATAAVINDPVNLYPNGIISNGTASFEYSQINSSIWLNTTVLSVLKNHLWLGVSSNGNPIMLPVHRSNLLMISPCSAIFTISATPVPVMICNMSQIGFLMNENGLVSATSVAVSSCTLIYNATGNVES